VIADAPDVSFFAIAALLAAATSVGLLACISHGYRGRVVIARWAWKGLMGADLRCVLLDQTDDHVADEIRELVETTWAMPKLPTCHVVACRPHKPRAIAVLSGGRDKSGQHP